LQNKNPTAVIALGGHAFIRKGYRPTHEEHQIAARKIASILMELINRDYNLVITHGNGPQVGNLLLQNEHSPEEIPKQPLDVLVAMTEGSLGYIMQQAIINELRRRGIHRHVVTKITQVILDQHDPAFKNPSKPIGPFYTHEQALELQENHNWEMAEDSGRGWRRLVPSPSPLKVIQRHTIKDAAMQGHIVIAAGGGGIPVVKQIDQKTGDFSYVGVEAVIDKDLTSSLLAKQVGAELFIILTDVNRVFINYNQPDQKPLGALNIEMTEKYLDDGHFAMGSMRPKIEAVLDFLQSHGKRALITSPENLSKALQGVDGTHFVGTI
jgi:carbamate kinase